MSLALASGSARRQRVSTRHSSVKGVDGPPSSTSQPTPDRTLDELAYSSIRPSIETPPISTLLEPHMTASRVCRANDTTTALLEILSRQLLQILLARQFKDRFITEYCSPALESVWHFFGHLQGLDAFVQTCSLCFQHNSKFHFTVLNSCAMLTSVGEEGGEGDGDGGGVEATVWVTLQIANLPSFEEADVMQETAVCLDWLRSKGLGWMCTRVAMIRGGPGIAGRF